MSYGLKYILRYETERFGTDIRLLISPKDYTGEPSYRRIGANRIHLTMDRDDKIKGCTLDFSIMSTSDSEYASFFGLDNKAHKVELEFNWGIIWTGYIVASQYSEPFIAPPYPVTIMATDGLGLLKNEKFELTGIVSRFEALRYCIDKTGISLPYAININIWEQNMNPALHNMLDQLYFDASILSDKTCYEAINAILPENCFINQANGYWMIERPTDRILPRYIFNADGTPSNTEYNWHTFLRELNTIEYSRTHQGSLYPIGYLTQDTQSAWRKFTIKQIYGKRESFFRNHDFKKGAANWTTGAFFQAKNINDKYFALLTGFQSSLTNYIYQSVKVVKSRPVYLKISYTPVGYQSSEILSGLIPLTVNCTFQLYLTGNSGTVYYLDQKGWTANTAKNIEIKDVQTSPTLNTLNFQELSVTADKFPEDGIITVKIYQCKGQLPTGRTRVAFSGLAIESVKIYTDDLAAFPDSEETEVVLNANATESEKTIEFKPCDLPAYENANLYFDNGNYVSVSGEFIPAAKWGSQQKTYLEYMSAYMAYLYKNSRTILKGTISGWLELNSYIIHNSGNKIYMIDKGTWNVLEHTFDLELIELPAGEFIYDNYAQVLPDPWKPTFDIDDVDFIKTIDGSFDVPLPETTTPVIVSRRQTIDPLKLDFDSGTPQFSIKDAVVETNVGDNANAVKIGAGEIISHHYAALDRTSIRFIKEANEQYDPTRAWDIAETDIELPDNDGYFLYVKVPLAEQLPE